MSLLLIGALVCQELAHANPELKPINLSFELFSDTRWAKDFLPDTPESVATLESAHQSKKNGTSSSKVVVLLQDAHTNYSAQKNQAAFLDRLLKKHPDISHVYTEAAWGDVSLSELRQQSALEQRTLVAEKYLRKGLLHGVEYLDVTSTHAFTIWGVEDPTQYQRSVSTYAAIAQKREAFDAYIASFESGLQWLAPRLLDPLLQKFESNRRAFQKDVLPLTDYFNYLWQSAKHHEVPVSQMKRLAELKHIQSLEKDIDFERANQELATASRQLPLSGQSRELFKASAHLPEAAAGFFAMVKESIPAGTYPELDKYLTYLERIEAADMVAMLDEMSSLEEALLQKLLTSDEESRWVRSARAAEMLHKMLALTLSPSDYQRYQTRAAEHDMEVLTGFLNEKLIERGAEPEQLVFLRSGFKDSLKACETFYELTLKRDEAFVRQLIEKMDIEAQSKAVLITGGYHTPNIQRLLREKGISYISVTPQVQHETNLARYEKILFSQDLQKMTPATSGGAARMNMTLYAKVPGAPAEVRRFIDELSNYPENKRFTPLAATAGARLAQRPVEFSARAREQMWDILKLQASDHKIHDVLIIGGGAAGAGVAREAAMLHMDTVLVEKGDFASGASSNTSKAIHKGIRYFGMAYDALKKGDLKTFWDNLALVVSNAYAESRFQKMAPHLVKPVRFYIPVYENGPRKMWEMKAGLWLYQVLSRLFGGAYVAPVFESRAEVLRRYPNLKKNGLLGAAVFQDSDTDDAKLVRHVMRDAFANGAKTLSHVEYVQSSEAKPDGVGGTYYDVKIKNLLSRRSQGETITVRARQIVDATGAWIDQTSQKSKKASATRFIEPSRGIHLEIYDPAFVDKLWQPYADGQLSPFLVDQNDKIIFITAKIAEDGSRYFRVGPTDASHEDPDHVYASEADVFYLIDKLAEYFPDIIIDLDQVRVDAGVRPLASDPKAQDLKAVSRNYQLIRTEDGVWHMPGVKLTELIEAGKKMARKIHRQLRKETSRRAEDVLNGAFFEEPVYERGKHGSLEAWIQHKITHEQLLTYSDLMFRQGGEKVLLAEDEQLSASLILKRLLGWTGEQRARQVQGYLDEKELRLKALKQVAGARLAFRGKKLVKTSHRTPGVISKHKDLYRLALDMARLTAQDIAKITKVKLKYVIADIAKDSELKAHPNFIRSGAPHRPKEVRDAEKKRLAESLTEREKILRTKQFLALLVTDVDFNWETQFGSRSIPEGLGYMGRITRSGTIEYQPKPGAHKFIRFGLAGGVQYDVYIDRIERDRNTPVVVFALKQGEQLISEKRMVLTRKVQWVKESAGSNQRFQMLILANETKSRHNIQPGFGKYLMPLLQATSVQRLKAIAQVAGPALVGAVVGPLNSQHRITVHMEDGEKRSVLMPGLAQDKGPWKGVVLSARFNGEYVGVNIIFANPMGEKKNIHVMISPELNHGIIAVPATDDGLNIDDHVIVKTEDEYGNAVFDVVATDPETPERLFMGKSVMSVARRAVASIAHQAVRAVAQRIVLGEHPQVLLLSPDVDGRHVEMAVQHLKQRLAEFAPSTSGARLAERIQGDVANPYLEDVPSSVHIPGPYYKNVFDGFRFFANMDVFMNSSIGYFSVVVMVGMLLSDISDSYFGPVLIGVISEGSALESLARFLGSVFTLRGSFEVFMFVAMRSYVRWKQLSELKATGAHYFQWLTEKYLSDSSTESGIEAERLKKLRFLVSSHVLTVQAVSHESDGGFRAYFYKPSIKERVAEELGPFQKTIWILHPDTLQAETQPETQDSTQEAHSASGARLAERIQGDVANPYLNDIPDQIHVPVQFFKDKFEDKWTMGVSLDFLMNQIIGYFTFIQVAVILLMENVDLPKPTILEPIAQLLRPLLVIPGMQVMFQVLVSRWFNRWLQLEYLKGKSADHYRALAEWYLSDGMPRAGIGQEQLDKLRFLVSSHVISVQAVSYASDGGYTFYFYKPGTLERVTGFFEPFQRSIWNLTPDILQLEAQHKTQDSAQEAHSASGARLAQRIQGDVRNEFLASVPDKIHIPASFIFGHLDGLFRRVIGKGIQFFWLALKYDAFYQLYSFNADHPDASPMAIVAWVVLVRLTDYIVLKFITAFLIREIVYTTTESYLSEGDGDMWADRETLDKLRYLWSIHKIYPMAVAVAYDAGLWVYFYDPKMKKKIAPWVYPLSTAIVDVDRHSTIDNKNDPDDGVPDGATLGAGARLATEFTYERFPKDQLTDVAMNRLTKMLLVSDKSGLSQAGWTERYGRWEEILKRSFGSASVMRLDGSELPYLYRDIVKLGHIVVKKKLSKDGRIEMGQPWAMFKEHANAEVEIEIVDGVPVRVFFLDDHTLSEFYPIIDLATQQVIHVHAGGIKNERFIKLPDSITYTTLDANGSLFLGGGRVFADGRPGKRLPWATFGKHSRERVRVEIRGGLVVRVTSLDSDLDKKFSKIIDTRSGKYISSFNEQLSRAEFNTLRDHHEIHDVALNSEGGLFMADEYWYSGGAAAANKAVTVKLVNPTGQRSFISEVDGNKLNRVYRAAHMRSDRDFEKTDLIGVFLSAVKNIPPFNGKNTDLDYIVTDQVTPGGKFPFYVTEYKGSPPWLKHLAGAHIEIRWSKGAFRAIRFISDRDGNPIYGNRMEPLTIDLAYSVDRQVDHLSWVQQIKKESAPNKVYGSSRHLRITELSSHEEISDAEFPSILNQAIKADDAAIARFVGQYFPLVHQLSSRYARMRRESYEHHYDEAFQESYVRLYHFFSSGEITASMSRRQLDDRVQHELGQVFADLNKQSGEDRYKNISLDVPGSEDSKESKASNLSSDADLERDRVFWLTVAKGLQNLGEDPEPYIAKLQEGEHMDQVFAHLPAARRDQIMENLRATLAGARLADGDETVIRETKKKLTTIMTVPYSNGQWKHTVLPTFQNELLGVTDSGGRIILTPYSGYQYQFHPLGYSEAGWKVVVVDGQKKNGVYELNLLMTKDGRDDISRTMQIGEYLVPTYLKSESRMDDSMLTRDIGDDLGNKLLARILSKTPAELLKPSATMADLRGYAFKKTDINGETPILVGENLVTRLRLLGKSQKGWAGSIVSSRLENGILTFEVDLQKAGEKKISRVFQVGLFTEALEGRRDRAGEQHPILRVSTKLGLDAIASLLSIEDDAQFEDAAKKMPSLSGAIIGVPNSKGQIRFAPIDWFNYYWNAIDFPEAGWKGTIHTSSYQEGVFRFSVQFLSPDGRTSFVRNYMIGRSTIKLTADKRAPEKLAPKNFRKILVSYDFAALTTFRKKLSELILRNAKDPAAFHAHAHIIEFMEGPHFLSLPRGLRGAISALEDGLDSLNEINLEYGEEMADEKIHARVVSQAKVISGYLVRLEKMHQRILAVSGDVQAKTQKPKVKKAPAMRAQEAVVLIPLSPAKHSENYLRRVIEYLRAQNDLTIESFAAYTGKPKTQAREYLEAEGLLSSSPQAAGARLPKRRTVKQQEILNLMQRWRQLVASGTSTADERYRFMDQAIDLWSAQSVYMMAYSNRTFKRSLLAMALLLLDRKADEEMWGVFGAAVSEFNKAYGYSNSVPDILLESVSGFVQSNTEYVRLSESLYTAPDRYRVRLAAADLMMQGIHLDHPTNSADVEDYAAATPALTYAISRLKKGDLTEVETYELKTAIARFLTAATVYADFYREPMNAEDMERVQISEKQINRLGDIILRHKDLLLGILNEVREQELTRDAHSLQRLKWMFSSNFREMFPEIDKRSLSQFLLYPDADAGLMEDVIATITERPAHGVAWSGQPGKVVMDYDFASGFYSNVLVRDDKPLGARLSQDHGLRSTVHSVLLATRRTGAVMIGSTKFHVKMKGGKVQIYERKGFVWSKPFVASSGRVVPSSKSGEATLEMSQADFMTLLKTFSMKVDAMDATYTDLKQQSALAVIPIDKFMHEQTWDESVRVLSAQLTKIFKADAKAGVVLAGVRADKVYEDLMRLNPKLSERLYLGEENIPLSHRESSRTVLEALDNTSVPTPVEGRRLFVQALPEGAVYNFYDLIRLALIEARMGELSTSNPVLVDFMRTWGDLLGEPIKSIEQFMRVLSGQEQNIQIILQYAFLPKPLPIQMQARAYSLMVRQIAQAA